MLSRARRQRGVTLVELMVGTVAGMLVVAGALSIFSAQVVATRRTMLEVRINQDLRAAADLVARDLRRAAYWQNAIDGTRTAPGTSVTTPNPYRAVQAASSSLAYQFSRDSVENNALDTNEQFGFRLDTDTRALQMQTSNGAWQQLTDPAALRITAFTITPRDVTLQLGDLCPKACPAGNPACPTVSTRSYELVLAGQAVADATVQRELRMAVRVRNDRLEGACQP
jgi:prepilin peptidase dependent protein B